MRNAVSRCAPVLAEHLYFRIVMIVVKRHTLNLWDQILGQAIELARVAFVPIRSRWRAAPVVAAQADHPTFAATAVMGFR